MNPLMSRSPNPRARSRSWAAWPLVGLLDGRLLAVVCVAAACSADGSLPDPAGPASRVLVGPGPMPALCINEFVASSDTSWLDADGTAPDWIELHNPTSEAVSLGAYVLTDAPDATDAAPLDDSLVVPAGGFLVVVADGKPELGPTHLPFSLNAEGEELALLHVGGGEVLSFGVVQTDFAWARSTDCCVDTPSCIEQVWLGTPGTTNGGL